MNEHAVKLAAPAPLATDDDEAPLQAHELLRDAAQHRLCEAWSAWCRTRRFYSRPSLPPSILGRLTARTRSTGGDGGGPDAIASAELSALHLAIIGQPADALDRQVFELHYLWRVKNVKAAAAAVGVGRQHWYTLVREFRSRVVAASRELLAHNQHAAQQLPSVAAAANTTEPAPLSTEKVSPPEATL
jgi:hypothetical protein